MYRINMRRHIYIMSLRTELSVKTRAAYLNGIYSPSVPPKSHALPPLSAYAIGDWLKAFNDYTAHHAAELHLLVASWQMKRLPHCM